MLKLGTETGSLFNHIDSNAVVIDEKSGKKIEPAVGVGCTILHWTDRTAGTIIEISKSGKRLVVQEDKATRTDQNGMSDAQTYSYARNPNGAKREFRLTKKGWRATGGGPGLLIGARDQHYDYTF